jgi:hypothetical protein
MKWMQTSRTTLSALCLFGALSLGHIGVATAATTQASAPAAEPSVLERTENATKKAVNTTENAISKVGKKIDAKVPRTEAYKKKHPKKSAASAAK